MSEYSFPCWNEGCGDIVNRDWDEVEEDVSGQMAYCSKGCFSEHCQKMSDRFNSRYTLEAPYVVGNAQSEEQLFTRLKEVNPYIAHSIAEEEVENFSGNWHWIWVPHLEALKEFAQEVAQEEETIEQVMQSIEHSEWEEFLAFTHPVKGIALIQVWERFQDRSLSMYMSQGKLNVETSPSASAFMKK